MRVRTLEPVHIIDVHLPRDHPKGLCTISVHLSHEVLVLDVSLDRRGILDDSQGVGSCSGLAQDAPVRLNARFPGWLRPLVERLPRRPNIWLKL